MSFCLFVAIPPCVCTMNDLFKRWKKSGVDAHEIPFKPARRTDLYFSFLHAAISHQHRFLLLVGFVSTTASPFFSFFCLMDRYGCVWSGLYFYPTTIDPLSHDSTTHDNFKLTRFILQISPGWLFSYSRFQIVWHQWPYRHCVNHMIQCMCWSSVSFDMGHLFIYFFFWFHVLMFSRFQRRRHTNGQFGTVIGGIMRVFFISFILLLLLLHQKFYIG